MATRGSQQQSARKLGAASTPQSPASPGATILNQRKVTSLPETLIYLVFDYPEMCTAKGKAVRKKIRKKKTKQNQKLRKAVLLFSLGKKSGHKPLLGDQWQ